MGVGSVVSDGFILAYSFSTLRDYFFSNLFRWCPISIAQPGKSAIPSRITRGPRGLRPSLGCATATRPLSDERGGSNRPRKVIGIHCEIGVKSVMTLCPCQSFEKPQVLRILRLRTAGPSGQRYTA